MATHIRRPKQNPKAKKPRAKKKTKKKPGPKSRLPWDAIERDYRTGVLSVRALAAHYGCSETVIRMRVRKHGWTRDLKSKIAEQTRRALAGEPPTMDDVDVRDKPIVEHAVANSVRLVQMHRGDIYSARSLVNTLFNELSTLCQNPDQLRQALKAYADEVTAEISDQRVVKNMRRAILDALSLPQRTAAARNLAQAIRALVPLERQAHGLDVDPRRETPKEYEPIEERVKRFTAMERAQNVVPIRERKKA